MTSKRMAQPSSLGFGNIRTYSRAPPVTAGLCAVLDKMRVRKRDIKAKTSSGTQYLIYYAIGDAHLRPVGLFTGAISEAYRTITPYALRRNNGQIQVLPYDSSSESMINDYQHVMQSKIAPSDLTTVNIAALQDGRVYVFGERARGFCFEAPGFLELNGILNQATLTDEGLVTEQQVSRNCLVEVGQGVAFIYICDYREVVILYDEKSKYIIKLMQQEGVTDDGANGMKTNEQDKSRTPSNLTKIENETTSASTVMGQSSSSTTTTTTQQQTDQQQTKPLSTAGGGSLLMMPLMPVVRTIENGKQNSTNNVILEPNQTQQQTIPAPSASTTTTSSITEQDKLEFEAATKRIAARVTKTPSTNGTPTQLFPEISAKTMASKGQTRSANRYTISITQPLSRSPSMKKTLTGTRSASRHGRESITSSNAKPSSLKAIYKQATTKNKKSKYAITPRAKGRSIVEVMNIKSNSMVKKGKRIQVRTLVKSRSISEVMNDSSGPKLVVPREKSPVMTQIDKSSMFCNKYTSHIFGPPPTERSVEKSFVVDGGGGGSSREGGQKLFTAELSPDNMTTPTISSPNESLSNSKTGGRDTSTPTMVTATSSSPDTSTMSTGNKKVMMMVNKIKENNSKLTKVVNIGGGVESQEKKQTRQKRTNRRTVPSVRTKNKQSKSLSVAKNSDEKSLSESNSQVKVTNSEWMLKSWNKFVGGNASRSASSGNSSASRSTKSVSKSVKTRKRTTTTTATSIPKSGTPSKKVTPTKTAKSLDMLKQRTATSEMNMVKMVKSKFNPIKSSVAITSSGRRTKPMSAEQLKRKATLERLRDFKEDTNTDALMLIDVGRSSSGTKSQAQIIEKELRKENPQVSVSVNVNAVSNPSDGSSDSQVNVQQKQKKSPKMTDRAKSSKANLYKIRAKMELNQLMRDINTSKSHFSRSGSRSDRVKSSTIMLNAKSDAPPTVEFTKSDELELQQLSAEVEQLKEKMNKVVSILQQLIENVTETLRDELYNDLQMLQNCSHQLTPNEFEAYSEKIVDIAKKIDIILEQMQQKK